MKYATIRFPELFLQGFNITRTKFNYRGEENIMNGKPPIVIDGDGHVVEVNPTYDTIEEA